MSSTAALIIVGVVVVLAVLIVIQQRRSRPQRATQPDATIEAAWDAYFARPGEAMPRDQTAIASLAASQPAARERLLDGLREIGARAIASGEPLVVLRQAIMDFTDSFIMSETLFEPASDDDAQASDPDATVQAGVLRCFSRMRYADAGPDDWYTHYLRVAEMNSRNVNAMLQKTLSGEKSAMETSLHGPLSDAMRDAREALLRHPPQTPVSRATHLTPGPQPERHAPTQSQVDRLTELVGEHFERLFTGQAYRLQDGTLIDPVAAFEVDAALLHAAMSRHFRNPTEAWRRILAGALGGRSEVVADGGEKLLDIAHKVRRAWHRSGGDGGFGLAIRAACDEVFAKAGSDGPAEPAVIAEDMLADAAAMIGAIQDITRSEG